jgi:hypothetical protein
MKQTFSPEIRRFLQQNHGELGQRPQDHQRARQGKPHFRVRQEILRRHQ